MSSDSATDSPPGGGSDDIVVTDADARKVAFGAFVGTALEWYDFFLYGTAASLVFNQLFFATKDPLVSTMAAFADLEAGRAMKILVDVAGQK